MKHHEIVKELVEKYSKKKEVIGIYTFGSLAKGNATEKSDVDIEIVFEKRSKGYELINKTTKGIKIDLSMVREDIFIRDFTDYLYINYAGRYYKILYDPKGILKKYLARGKRYFKDNPSILKFWQKKEKAWKKAKKQGKKGVAENYFDIVEELKRKLK